ncbi:tripartite tricarboxylate transporter TctB family protein [Pseudothermotoga sp. U03pept]|uniref:tripartite tricarboxylate transporter TctB family protein n=1 Tax=Pseudothermotoga sp. U03pept TaxID=3447012 RepID=UPI003F08B4A4
MSSRAKDLLSGSIVFLTGFAFYLQTLKIRPVKIGLSPADFPRLITTMMMICGAVLVLKALVTKHVKQKRDFESGNLKKIGFLVAVFFFYALLLDRIGFVYLTPVFLFASMYVFGMKRHLLNIIISITTTIAVYLVFAHVFKVPLPRFSL